MRFRILDIETVPDPSVWTPGDPKFRWVLEPGVWANGLGHVLGETGTLVPSLVPDVTFPPIQAHRVVAIASLDVVMDPRSSPRYRFEDARSWCDWTLDPAWDDSVEKGLLERFADLQSGVQADTIVTWNGRGFDLPVLSMRSMKHGISFGWYYQSRNMRYRFTDEGHLDLMDYLGDYGASRQMKLSDACRLVGLPGKTDMTGALVADVVARTKEHPETLISEIEEVRRYCLEDVVQTALVWLRTRHHFGLISAEEHDACAQTFRASRLVGEAVEVEWDRFLLAR